MIQIYSFQNKLCFCLLIIFSLISLSSCSGEKQVKISTFTTVDKKLFTESAKLLGTTISISIIAPSIEKARKTFEQVFKEIYRIEKLMNPFRAGSDVVLINSSATQTPVPVSEEVYNLIKKSCAISNETNGAFDITFAPLGELWNFKTVPFAVPRREKLLKAISLVDYQFIQYNEDDFSIFLNHEGVKIGLGGIAKGYAIKQAIEVLKKNGIHSGIVEAGGDLQVLGNKFNKAWRAGLINPRSTKSLLLSVELNHKDSLATSGDYERFVLVNNERYHHIINPQTGMPAKTFASVTVLCKDPVQADALSTAFFVMGKEKVKKYLKKKKGIQVILVDLNMNIFASKSLKKKIKFINKKFLVTWF